MAIDLSGIRTNWQEYEVVTNSDYNALNQAIIDLDAEEAGVLSFMGLQGDIASLAGSTPTNIDISAGTFQLFLDDYPETYLFNLEAITSDEIITVDVITNDVSLSRIIGFVNVSLSVNNTIALRFKATASGDVLYTYNLVRTGANAVIGVANGLIGFSVWASFQRTGSVVSNLLTVWDRAASTQTGLAQLEQRVTGAETAISLTQNSLNDLSGEVDNLTDEVDSNTSNIATNTANINTVTTNLANHIADEVYTENGVHGLRYYNNLLQFYNGTTWETIETGSSGGAVESLYGLDGALQSIMPSQTQNIDASSGSMTLNVFTNPNVGVYQIFQDTGRPNIYLTASGANGFSKIFLIQNSSNSVDVIQPYCGDEPIGWAIPRGGYGVFFADSTSSQVTMLSTAASAGTTAKTDPFIAMPNLIKRNVRQQSISAETSNLSILASAGYYDLVCTTTGTHYVNLVDSVGNSAYIGTANMTYMISIGNNTTSQGSTVINYDNSSVELDNGERGLFVVSYIYQGARTIFGYLGKVGTDGKWIPAGGSGEVVKSNNVITIGTTTNGHTAGMCDVLCDGVDDDVEIQAAFNQYVTGTQGDITFEFLPGTYTVNSNILVPPWGDAAVSIVGSNLGCNAIISRKEVVSNNDLAIFYSTAADGVRSDPIGKLLIWNLRFEIDNCLIWFSSTNTLSDFWQWENLTIRDCDISGTNCKLCTSYNTSVWIDRCKFQSTLAPVSNTLHSRVTYISGANSASSAVDFEHLPRFKITNCNFKINSQNSQDQIDFIYCVGGNTIITNNSIHVYYGDQTASQFTAFTVSSAQSVVCSNNSVARYMEVNTVAHSALINTSYNSAYSTSYQAVVISGNTCIETNICHVTGLSAITSNTSNVPGVLISGNTCTKYFATSNYMVSTTTGAMSGTLRTMAITGGAISNAAIVGNKITARSGAGISFSPTGTNSNYKTFISNNYIYNGSGISTSGLTGARPIISLSIASEPSTSRSGDFIITNNILLNAYDGCGLMHIAGYAALSRPNISFNSAKPTPNIVTTSGNATVTGLQSISNNLTMTITTS